MERVLELKTRLADFSIIEAALHDMTGREGLSVTVAADARLALEEAFTNIVKYAHGDGRDHHPVTVRVALQAGWLELELIDDGTAFDPVAHTGDELEKPFAERADGLMGIPLIRALMDECRYRRTGSFNHLLLRKRFGM